MDAMDLLFISVYIHRTQYLKLMLFSKVSVFRKE